MSNIVEATWRIYKKTNGKRKEWGQTTQKVSGSADSLVPLVNHWCHDLQDTKPYKRIGEENQYRAISPNWKYERNIRTKRRTNTLLPPLPVVMGKEQTTRSLVPTASRNTEDPRNIAPIRVHHTKSLSDMPPTKICRRWRTPYSKENIARSVRTVCHIEKKPKNLKPDQQVLSNYSRYLLAPWHHSEQHCESFLIAVVLTETH